MRLNVLYEKYSSDSPMADMVGESMNAIANEIRKNIPELTLMRLTPRFERICTKCGKHPPDMQAHIHQRDFLLGKGQKPIGNIQTCVGIWPKIEFWAWAPQEHEYVLAYVHNLNDNIEGLANEILRHAQ